MAKLIIVDGPDETGVARVTLNRPEKRNALSVALRDEVSDALDALAADETTKTVVVTGAGDVFCAGFDLKEFEVPDVEFQERLWESSDRFHRTVLCFPLPLVAAVNGPALAGGCDLAVMCDIRVATTTSRFAHPEHTFGDVVYSPLRDLVGGAVARDLCFTGRSIDAEEACRLHLVSEVVPPEGLDAAVAQVTGQITEAPREVLLRTKAKVLTGSGIRFDTSTLQL